MCATVTNRLLPIVIFLAACPPVSVPEACAEPPRVVRITPENGDEGVDPATSAIRIEFDQDMSPGGRSLCGGGDSFPEFTGQPVWETPRVMVIPVRLSAGRTYAFGVNCFAARNFRNVAGQSAVIEFVGFTTARDGAAPTPTRTTTPEQNEQSLNQLARAIDERYAYRDRLVADWPSRIDAAKPDLIAAETPAVFARRAAHLLSAAQDRHVWVRIGEAGFGVDSREITPNIDLSRLRKAIPELKQPVNQVITGRWPDGVGYIFISEWPGDWKTIEPAFTALRTLADCSGLIIDVRLNGGGDERTARRFAEHFVREPAVYSLNRYRDPQQPDGWTKMYDRVIDPLGKGEDKVQDGDAPFAGRVAVLIGPNCLSSNESFVLMMKHGGHATLVGETTGGSSGNPRPVDLPNGVTVFLPSWQDYLPDGTLLEGRGITPDMQAALGPGPQDGVLETALRSVRGQ